MAPDAPSRPGQGRAPVTVAALGALIVTAAGAGCAAPPARQVTTAPAPAVSVHTYHPWPGPASMPAVPLPAATARRLPRGVFYLLAGPPQASAWASVWQVTGGRQQIVTRGDIGRWIESLALSARGMVVTVDVPPYAEIARWTRTGPVWLHPNGRPHWADQRSSSRYK